MTGAEAHALVTALAEEFSYPSRDLYVLERREAVESYGAEQSTDGSWRVLLRWAQGVYRFGVVIEELADAVVVGEPTAAQAALDLRMLYVEEPHGPEGVRDESGRVWLQE